MKDGSVDALSGGFSAPSTQSAFAFRQILRALSEPGVIVDLEGASPPAPLSAAAGALALTLLDGGTPVHLAGSLDCAALRNWITFHCGAPLCDAGSAAFAFGTWADLAPFDRFAIGLADYPDRSVTLIVEVPQLSATGYRLRGPGIETERFLSVPDAAPFQANRALFPQGFDAVFTCGNRLAGLPRTTIVEHA